MTGNLVAVPGEAFFLSFRISYGAHLTSQPVGAIDSPLDIK
jgi:hypothetical protein